MSNTEPQGDGDAPVGGNSLVDEDTEHNYAELLEFAKEVATAAAQLQEKTQTLEKKMAAAQVYIEELERQVQQQHSPLPGQAVPNAHMQAMMESITKAIGPAIEDIAGKQEDLASQLEELQPTIASRRQSKDISRASSSAEAEEDNSALSVT